MGLRSSPAPSPARRWASLIGVLAFAAAAAADAGTGSTVSVEGTSLRAVFADGSSLAGPELAGRELVIADEGGEIALRIGAVQEDSTVPGLFLYELLLEGRPGEWNNICEPDREGNRWAIPLAGHSSADGLFEPAPDRLTLTCTSGVQGKCLRAGYLFWKPGPGADGTLLEHFQACTRLFRADYCGDGRGWTADGMLIDIFDDAGLQSPEPHTDLAFEAGWSPGGAVCVHHTRVAKNVALDELLRRCPRLARAPSGAHCTPARARRAGAILFNSSRAKP